MAISHAHLTLLLLLSFFWLPTLLAIAFEDCGYGSSPVNVTSVEIIQDKVMASFQISGFTSKTISGGYMKVNVKLGSIPILNKTYDLCENITCPIAPGAFVLPSDKMFSAQIPAKFRVFVNIFDSSDDEELMCLAFNVDQTKRSAVVSA